MLRKFTENNFIIRTKFISTCSSDFKTTFITKGVFIIDLSQSGIHENIIHQNWVSIRGMDNLFDDRLIGSFWKDNAFKLNKFLQWNDHFSVPLSIIIRLLLLQSTSYLRSAYSCSLLWQQLSLCGITHQQPNDDPMAPSKMPFSFSKPNAFDWYISHLLLLMI